MARANELLRRTYDLLNDVPRSRIRVVDVEPKLKRGESLSDALARVRAEIEVIEAERRQVEAAPLPSGLVKQAMAAQVEALAAEGQLTCSALFYGRSLTLPRIVQAPRPRGALPDFERLPADIGAVVLAVIAPMVIDHLGEKIDAAAAQLDPIALTPEEKADKLKALAERLLDRERAEEAILDRLEGTVPRRDGMNPQAWLCVEIAAELDVPEAA